jgi:DNA repair protein RecO (recombination protein O)
MICSTPGFVLRSFDFRETSKIATFFTRDYGKVKGILKGIRSDAKKFGSSLSLLSLNHVVFYSKRNSEIHLVGQCDLIDTFGMTQQPVLKGFAYASHIAELVDVLMPLEDAQPRVFDLIFDFLNTFKENTADTRSFFQIKILSLSGFKPHFDSCLGCAHKITKEAYFSSSRGGLLCRECLSQDRHATPILQGTVAAILYIERSDWKKALRLNLSATIRKQLESILLSFIHFHIGRALKTNKPVRELLDI